MTLKAVLCQLSVVYVVTVVSLRVSAADSRWQFSSLSLLPATGGGVKIPPSAVLAQNNQISSGIRQLLFVTLSQTLLAFRRN